MGFVLSTSFFSPPRVTFLASGDFHPHWRILSEENEGRTCSLTFITKNIELKIKWSLKTFDHFSIIFVD